MNDKIIEVKDLSVIYGDKTILKNIDFHIFRGEIFVIAGGSGCGKSTLLRQLIGLEIPYSGDIFINGVNFTDSKQKIRNEIMRDFGVLFQSSGLIASMTIEENIELPLREFTDLDDKDISEIVRIKLGLVGLDGYEEFLPSELSGGMRKRAGIARAMALDPDILFLDEPSSGLDPVTAAALDKLIININNSLKTTIVVVTHDLSSIFNIAHRLILLDKSKMGIIAQGAPNELKQYNKDSIVYNFFNRIG